MGEQLLPEHFLANTGYKKSFSDHGASLCLQDPLCRLQPLHQGIALGAGGWSGLQGCHLQWKSLSFIHIQNHTLM